MSFKAKNLHFSAPEAPFLKGLRAAQPNDADVPRQSVYGRQRSRVKLDEDDGPLILDEEGNEVSKEAMGRLEEGESKEGDEAASRATNGGEKKAEATSIGGGGGGGKKRKLARVVGATEEDGKGGGVGGAQESGSDGDDGRRDVKDAKATRKPAGAARKPKTKKQKKAVGLSFGDDDG